VLKIPVAQFPSWPHDDLALGWRRYLSSGAQHLASAHSVDEQENERRVHRVRPGGPQEGHGLVRRPRMHLAGQRQLTERNMLIGGEPGGGKSVALQRRPAHQISCLPSSRAYRR
jgi:hypothetical protein